jgi:hypothetical protein
VLRSRLDISDSASAGEWTFTMVAPLDTGEESTLGYGVVPLDAGGQPTSGPDFVLEKRFFRNGVEHRISVIDDATGQSVSLTSLAIEEAMKRFKARYPGGPDEPPGSLADNKANFRNEYLKGARSGHDTGRRQDPRDSADLVRQAANRAWLHGVHRGCQRRAGDTVRRSSPEPSRPEAIRIVARKP